MSRQHPDRPLYDWERARMTPARHRTDDEVAKFREDLAALERKVGMIDIVDRKIGKVSGGIGEMGQLIAQLKKIAAGQRDLLAKCNANETLRKASRDMLKRDHEIADLQRSLRRSAALKKSAKWAKIPRQNRVEIQKAENAANKRLAKLEAEKKASSRSVLASDAAKNRAAMVRRGVHFHKMGPSGR